MDDSEKDRFRDACRREVDGRIRVRMLAVHMRCAQGRTEEAIASTLLQCPAGSSNGCRDTRKAASTLS